MRWSGALAFQIMLHDSSSSYHYHIFMITDQIIIMISIIIKMIMMIKNVDIFVELNVDIYVELKYVVAIASHLIQIIQIIHDNSST